MKKLIIVVIFFLINSCAQTESNIKNPNIATTKADDLIIYKNIYKNIKANNLDRADENYVNLKTNFDNSTYLKDAATNLAVAHMAKKEYILANFYLQEALNIDSSDEFLKFLLNQNQFLAIVENKNDKSYANKGFAALKENKNLLYTKGYKLLADSMYNRVRLDLAYENLKVGELYKKMNKQKAYNLYSKKVRDLGVDINSLIKP
jgi:outer membrane protein assembly factor BamD